MRRALRGPCRLAPGTRLLVAVSGGADSTALLLALRRVAPEFGVELHAAHLNHGLRGAAAAADQAFVAALCEAAAIPLHSARWRTRARLRRRGLAGENGLRVLRREFLAAVARRTEAAAIATAHTADDQLETVLLRLARGSGLAGLGGMRPRSGRWIKPLLAATRAAVEADLRRIGQPWREDATNALPTFARNRVRHRVIPALLEALTPGLATAASEARPALARRVAALAAELRSADRALVGTPGDRAATSWRSADLLRQPAAARWARYRGAFRSLAGPSAGLTRAHLRQLDALARGAAGPVQLPQEFSGVREGDVVRLRPGRIQQPKGHRAPAGPDRATSLAVPGSAVRPGFSVVGRWMPSTTARERISEMPGSEEYFAAEGLRGGLEVRLPRADDVFVPFGRKRSVPLGDFLKKLPVRHRTAVPFVLADASGILWVIGVRRSARAPVRPSSRKVLCVHLERHD